MNATPTAFEKRIQLRKARGEDKQAIVRISRSTVNFVVEEEWLDDLVKTNTHTVIVAVHDSHVVGFLIFVVREDGVYITHMAVEATLRRNGIGKILMRKLMNDLQDHGKNSIKMVVDTNDVQCLDFCKAVGFRSVGVMNNYYERGKAAQMLSFDTSAVRHR